MDGRRNSLDRRQEQDGQAGAAEAALTYLTSQLGIIYAAGRTELCLVRCMAPGWLRAKMHRLFEPGESVRVELSSDDSVWGTVAWVRGDEIKVTFSREIDVQAILSARNLSRAGLRPRAVRIRINAPAVLHRSGEQIGALLSDISQGGAKLVTGAPCGVGEKVLLHLHGLPMLAAEVRWERDGAAGLQFAQPITLPALSQWLGLVQRSRMEWAFEESGALAASSLGTR